MSPRVATLLFALAVTIFVQVGQYSNCTFGLCCGCEVPVPEPVEETHACCQVAGEQPLEAASKKAKPYHLMGGCDSECMMKCAAGHRIWPLIKAFHVSGVPSDDELLSAECYRSGETVQLADVLSPTVPSPPGLHCSISSTVLLL